MSINFVVPELHVLARPSSVLWDHFPGQPSMPWPHDAHATAPELVVEFAGRTCYLSFGERQHTHGNAAYIQSLISKGHHSVLEHASWTFLFKNISRATATQLTRHRAGWSFSQLSQQYFDQSVGYVLPPPLRDGEFSEMIRPLLVSVESNAAEIGSAFDLLESKTSLGAREYRRMSRSAKRAILPNMAATHLVCTANARALRHVLKERGNISGDPEIRELCVLMLRAFQQEAPSLFRDFVIRPEPDEIGSVQTQ